MSTPDQKKRKFRYNISYSNVTIEDAQRRLGITFDDIMLTTKSIKDMIKVLFEHQIGGLKEKVYERITDHIDSEGYPTMSSKYFKETNVNDLVYTIIAPIISDFKRRTNYRNIKLIREKEIVSKDFEVGGNEEFVVVDYISLEEEKYIIVVESKRNSLGEAMKQCFLSLKDMKDSNDTKTISNNYNSAVYGFMTIGDSWQMVVYDGKQFQMSEEFKVMFGTMEQNKERWMKDFSIIVDCIYYALSQQTNPS